MPARSLSTDLDGAIMPSDPGANKKPGHAVFFLILGVPLVFAGIVGGLAIAKKLEVRAQKRAAAEAGAPAAEAGRGR